MAVWGVPINDRGQCHCFIVVVVVVVLQVIGVGLADLPPFTPRLYTCNSTGAGRY